MGLDVISFVAELPAGNGTLRFELAPDWRLEHLTPAPLHFLTGVLEEDVETTVLWDRVEDVDNPEGAPNED